MGKRRRPAGKTIYTIAYLLDKQPKGLRKDSRYGRMIETLSGSDALLSLRFNRRCYSLLHHAVVSPEHLNDFYRTYRLPRHPFFPLFLAVKRAYLDERERVKRERAQTIEGLLEDLSPQVIDYWKSFYRWECLLRQRKRAVIFEGTIYPKSEKRARLYLSYGEGEWILLFETYRQKVIAQVGASEDRAGRELLDRFILGLPPVPAGVTPGEIKSRYRELSLVYHPDRNSGGCESFLRLKDAFERLYAQDRSSR